MLQKQAQVTPAATSVQLPTLDDVRRFCLSKHGVSFPKQWTNQWNANGAGGGPAVYRSFLELQLVASAVDPGLPKSSAIRCVEYVVAALNMTVKDWKALEGGAEPTPFLGPATLGEGQTECDTIRWPVSLEMHLAFTAVDYVAIRAELQNIFDYLRTEFGVHVRLGSVEVVNTFTQSTRRELPI